GYDSPVPLPRVRRSLRGSQVRGRGGRELTSTILDEWAAANPRSRELHERASHVIPGGITHDVRRAAPFPAGLVGALGRYKPDADGQDATGDASGDAGLGLGHNPRALAEPNSRGSHGLLHPGSSLHLEVEWAERIGGLVRYPEKVLFASSRTE